MDGLKRASEDLLYEKMMGCDDKFTLLHSVLELMKLKASNRWFDKSFMDLLLLLRDIALEAKQVARQHLPSKEAYSSISLGCGKNTCVFEPLHPVPEGVRTL